MKLPVHTVKIVLALLGLGVFFAGARFQLTSLRWAGIGLVAAAWLLRFYKPPRDVSPSGDTDP